MNAAPDAVDQARQILAAGRYCILDVETTDLEGSIVEVAVIAADTGEVLFDELVNPGSVAMSAEAAAVHGIQESDLVGARQWLHVYPDLATAIGDRHIAAYNSNFDFGRIVHDCNRIGMDAGRIGDPERWMCLMDLRSSAHGSDTRLRLDGGHRALGDVHAARSVLLGIARGMAA
ncbi:3'-5' exonuclease [Rhodococcus baikonurensis]|uniref:Exonuclease domain-containing protein n=1 Tax=Rhodococcus baikonurensis TaxID=172041 RepID=A0ABV5XSC2_9NOCA